MKEIDEKSFDLIKKVASNISISKKISQGLDENSDIPYVIGIKLTNRCNLRCKHCYEWNESGYHHRIIKIRILIYQLLLNALKKQKKQEQCFIYGAVSLYCIVIWKIYYNV